jgi:hypothetical protein
MLFLVLLNNLGPKIYIKTNTKMKINTALFAVLNLADVLHWKMLLNTSTSFSNFHMTAGEKADLRI